MWGKTNPLFAVASWENRNREGTSPWTEDEFFQLGKSDWQDFVLRWERYGIDARACAEIGCGAGRLTKPMSAYFGKMDALDVSEGMLDYARKHVTTAQFHLVDGNTIPLPDRSVTAVFSAHVFQHFDSLDDATGYFNEIHRVLVTGGTMMIHLPIYWWPLGMGKLVWCPRNNW